MTRQTVLDALRTIEEPQSGRDIVRLGLVKGLDVSESRVAFTVVVPRGALVVIHEWWGLNDNVKHWTDRMAALWGSDSAYVRARATLCISASMWPRCSVCSPCRPPRAMYTSAGWRSVAAVSTRSWPNRSWASSSCRVR